MEEGFEFGVSVETTFIDSESDPDAKRFVFAYTIIVSNTGERRSTRWSR